MKSVPTSNQISNPIKLYPALSSFLLLRFDFYTLPNCANILPQLLPNTNSLQEPTLPYRTSPKLVSVPQTTHTGSIPSTSHPTTAFRIACMYPAIIVPCDPRRPASNGRPELPVGTSWKCVDSADRNSWNLMESHGISWNLGEYSVSVT